MLVDIIKTLEVVRPVAKILPGVGGMLEGVIETVITLAQIADTAKTLQGDWLKLAERAADITAAVVLALHTGRDCLAEVGPMYVSIGALMSALRVCEESARKVADMSWFKRVCASEKLKSDLEDCNGQLERSITMFNISAQIGHGNVLEELNAITEGGLAKLSTQLVDIREELAIVQTNTAMPAQHDGNYRLFLFSDFKLIRTRSSAGAAIEVHEALDIRTSRTCVVRRCRRSSQSIALLEALKETAHSNVECLLGYSGKTVGNPFYVFDAVNESFMGLRSASLDIKRKIEIRALYKQQVVDLESALDFMRTLPGVRWVWSAQLYSGAFEVGEMASSRRPSLMDIKLTSDYRLVLPLPLEDSKWEVGPNQQGGGQIADWVDARDATEIFYLQSLRELQGRYTPLFLATANVLEGAGLEWICREDEGTTETTTHFRHTQDDAFVDLKDTVMRSDRYDRYTLPACAPGSELRFRDVTTFFRNPWAHLARVVHGQAHEHLTAPSTVCAVASIYDRAQVTEIRDPLGHLRAQPTNISNNLFWFTYPPVAVGPRHISRGYLALDAQGSWTSTISSCKWDLKRREWNIRLGLGGRHFLVTRRIAVNYVRFSEEELAMLDAGMS